MSANRKKVTLLIPLTYNDGTSVPDAVLDAIEDEVYVAFNGWAVVGEVTRAYRMQSGQKQVDRLLQVCGSSLQKPKCRS